MPMAKSDRQAGVEAISRIRRRGALGQQPRRLGELFPHVPEFKSVHSVVAESFEDLEKARSWRGRAEEEFAINGVVIQTGARRISFRREGDGMKAKLAYSYDWNIGVFVQKALELDHPPARWRGICLTGRGSCLEVHGSARVERLGRVPPRKVEGHRKAGSDTRG